MKKSLLLIAAMGIMARTSAQVYLTEDFEGGSLPSGWAQSTLATDGGWNFGTNAQLESTSFPIDPHTKMACTNDDKCDCNKSNDHLYTLSIDLSSAGPQVFMTYASYFFNQTYQGITETAKITASNDGGVTWTDLQNVPGNSGTTWEINSIDLSAYSGMPDVRIGFLYNDGGGWLYGWAIDDIEISSPPAGVDLAVASVTTGKIDPRPAFADFSRYITGQPLDVQITVTNEASTPITSFDVSWTDGTNVYNQSVTGVNITTFQKYTFTATNPYTTLAGNQSVDVTVSNINSGATEVNTSNNMASHAIEGVTPDPDAHYLAEEGTGTWCGWCPRGDVYMHYMHNSYPGKFVGVAVHNGDPMTVAAYDGSLGITAFPGVRINRMATIDPMDLESDFIDRIGIPPAVAITGTAVLNSITNQLTVDLTGNFMQSLNGDYRFAAVVKEDSVHVIAAGYNQTNYYANNAYGPMGGFQSLPGTISSTLMYYDFVGRELMGGFTGQAGSLPSSISSGSTHSYQLTATLAGTYNIFQLAVVGLIRNNANGFILNATDIPVVITTGIQQPEPEITVALYPNPATDQLHLVTTLTDLSHVTVTVTDATGRLCKASDHGFLAAGTHQIDTDVSSLSSGVYFLAVETEAGRMVKKFSK